MSLYFELSLPVILAFEGGEVNDPDDPGGHTNKGITQGVYDAWRADHFQPKRPVSEIEDEEVEAIYYKRYWLAGHCYLMPFPLAMYHFDACVNHGVKGATRLLQKALGVKPDGIWGPVTKDAAINSDPYLAADSYLWQRARLYVGLAKDRRIRFLRGWINRLIRLREEGVPRDVHTR